MSFLDKIADFGKSWVGGLVGDVAGGLYGNYASAKAATKQFDREKWMMGHRYQLQVEDLKAAGLNPMLAVGATPPMPTPAMAPQRGPDLGRASAGQAASSAAQLTRAQINVADAQAAKLRAETVTEMSRPANVAAVTGREVASAGQISAETRNLGILADKLLEEMRLIAADIRYRGAQTATLDRMRELEAKVKSLEGQSRELRLPEDAARGEAGKKLVAGAKGVDSATGAAGQIGSWIAGKVADVRDYYAELRRQAAEARKKRQAAPRKPDWPNRFGGK